MTEMGMKVPPNSIPMVGGIGPHDEITMGGMFTILKVRESLSNYDEDPGWYTPPPGTLADLAPSEALDHHGISPDGATAPRAPAASSRPISSLNRETTSATRRPAPDTDSEVEGTPIDQCRRRWPSLSRFVSR